MALRLAHPITFTIMNPQFDFARTYEALLRIDAAAGGEAQVIPQLQFFH